MSQPPDRRHTEESDDDPGHGDLRDLPRLVSDIVDTMRKGNLEQLEVTRGDFRLSLRSFAGTGQGGHLQATNVREDPSGAVDGPDGDPINHIVTSPMIGTFYASPAPGEPAFVSPGDRVEQGQTIGIVEAMKIMNEIASDRSGTVIDVLAENGETVEYGSPLVVLSLDS